MSEVKQVAASKADVQNLSGFLDRLRDVLDPAAMEKATAALKSDPEVPSAEAASNAESAETVAAAVTPAANSATDAPPSETSIHRSGPETPSTVMRLLELGVTSLVSVVLALLLFTFTAKPTKPAISFAMLDANIAVAKYLETPGITDLDEQAFGAAVTEFHKALQVEMKQFSADTGRVLLAGSVVFAGDVPDVTDRLTSAAMAKVGKK